MASVEEEDVRLEDVGVRGVIALAFRLKVRMPPVPVVALAAGDRDGLELKRKPLRSLVS